MPRVNHFEIHAEDIDRAIAFYEAVFDWRFEPFGDYDYWLIHTGPEEEHGIDGGLVRRRGPIDGRSMIAFVCTVDVPDIDTALEAVKAAGGRQLMEKFPVAATGWLAYAKDTEGNIFGVLQRDEDA